MLKKINNQSIIYYDAYRNFTKSIRTIQDQIQSLLTTQNANLVVYDETEWFRDPDSQFFRYPFSNRKTILKKYNFDFSSFFNETDYPYSFLQIKVFRSETCLEPSVLAQMEFLGKFVKLLGDTWNRIINTTDTS